MRFSAPAKRRSGDALIPLINVVFLLVIFFMLAGTLEAAPPFPIAVPESHTEQNATKDEATIYLSADGQVALNASVMGIENVLAEMKTQQPSAKDMVVKIQADGRVSFRNLKALTQVLHGAGFESVSLLTAAAGDGK